MKLKDRIKAIMEREKLNASIFADTIDVQRSSISHILSGRNKPSLEFLQKVLTSYPKYSTEWLIMGIGEPLKESKTNNISYKQPTYDSEETPNLFSELEKHEQQQKNKENNITINEIESETDSKQASKVENIIKEKDIKDHPKGKEIEQIIVCYTDKTFMSYKPA